MGTRRYSTEQVIVKRPINIPLNNAVQALEIDALDEAALKEALLVHDVLDEVLLE